MKNQGLTNAQIGKVEKAYRYALNELDQFLPEIDCKRLFEIALSWFPVYQHATGDIIVMIGRAAKKEYMETM